MSSSQTDIVRVETEDRAGIQALTIAGRIDTRTAPDTRRELHLAIDSGDGILILDLGRCEVGDATGLGLLVEFHRRAARAGRRLHVVAIDERTRRLLRGIRLDRRILAA
jgi:anti-anti-sigma factor